MPPYAEYNIVVFWILLKTEEQKACSKSSAVSGATVRSPQEFWLQGREAGKRGGKERWEVIGNLKGFYLVLCWGVVRIFFKYSKFSQHGL